MCAQQPEKKKCFINESNFFSPIDYMLENKQTWHILIFYIN